MLLLNTLIRFLNSFTGVMNSFPHIFGSHRGSSPSMLLWRCVCFCLGSGPGLLLFCCFLPLWRNAGGFAGRSDCWVFGFVLNF